MTARARSYAEARVMGIVLLLGGIAWFLTVAGIYKVQARPLLAALLIVLGVGMIVIRRSGRGLFISGVLIIVVLATTPLQFESFPGSIGDRTVRPAEIDALEKRYELAVGSLELDTRNVTFPEGTTRVRIEVGVGELRVIVPGDVEVVGTGEVGLGQFSAMGRSIGDGTGVKGNLFSRGDRIRSTRKLELDMRLGIGDLSVIRDNA